MTVPPQVLPITINGETYQLRNGGSVLDALRTVGIRIPTLCHDDRLTPSGACRLCLVSIENWPRPVSACTTPLAAGMAIHTHTPALEEGRRSLLKLLAWRHPAEAFSRFPEKEFYRWIREYGLEGELRGARDPHLEDRSHPYVAADMNRCIDCYRCMRICDELQGQRVWHVRNRGLEPGGVPNVPSLRESSCVSCGACVDTCPTGALEDAGAPARGSASQWTRTTCPYCGTGCEMAVGTRDGRIVSVRSVLDAPVSKGHLCVKGRYAFDFVTAADRITEPMIRENGWRRTSWNEASAIVARRLRDQ